MSEGTVDKAAKLAALNAVLAAVHQHAGTVSTYECMVWIEYSMVRADARSMSQELLKSPDGQEAAGALTHTPKDEVNDYIDLVREGDGNEENRMEDMLKLAEELDQGLERPILGQVPWPFEEAELYQQRLTTK